MYGIKDIRQTVFLFRYFEKNDIIRRISAVDINKRIQGALEIRVSVLKTARCNTRTFIHIRIIYKCVFKTCNNNIPSQNSPFISPNPCSYCEKFL